MDHRRPSPENWARIPTGGTPGACTERLDRCEEQRGYAAFASSQRSLAAILLVAGPPGAIALVNRADEGMRRPIDELGLGARRPRGIASEEAQCRDKERASEHVIPDLR